MSDESVKLPLSLAIICKDNARIIERAIDSAAGLVSEIVAVDSGSTDRTIEILESRGATVHRSEWLGYIRTRQIAIEHCTQPWVLALDTDESLEPALARSIRETLSGDTEGVAAMEMNRKVWYAGRFLEHCWQPEWRLRLVRRELFPSVVRPAGAEPHDVIELDPAQAQPRGKWRVVRLTGDLRHDTAGDGFGAFLAGQVKLATTSARVQHERGKRGKASRIVVSPIGAFCKQLIAKGGYRDGWRGWCAAGSAAAATLMKHVTLLDLDRRAREGVEPDGSEVGGERS